MNTAEAMLTQMSGVPESSITSNQASQHSSVAVTSRQAMTIWRPRQNAQPVAANASRTEEVEPTQAPLQCWVWKERCRVRPSTMIQPTSTAQAMTDNEDPEPAAAGQVDPQHGMRVVDGGQRVRQLPPLGRAHLAQI